MDRYRVLGIMSGTSLDGVDLVLVDISLVEKQWQYEILSYTTVPYPEEWERKLSDAFNLHPFSLKTLDREYGLFLGQQINDFLYGKDRPDMIASHGHTVWHRPDEGVTMQIGDGETMYRETGIPVVFDFRSEDVSLGGQGAPLVPVGDQLFFGSYDACLNLGGFANISYDDGGIRRAYDICPVNIVINKLAQDVGLAFDRDGESGKKGEVNPFLLDQLNRLDYYANELPKSLGREWVEKHFFPLLYASGCDIYEQMATCYSHVVIQIANAVASYEKILVTGGGAYNSFLISLLKDKTKGQLVLPSPELIEYKEALIFALLAVLKVRGETNVLSSVTGASRDSSSGRMVGF